MVHYHDVGIIMYSSDREVSQELAAHLKKVASRPITGFLDPNSQVETVIFFGNINFHLFL
jgi:hypothetical protein